MKRVCVWFAVYVAVFSALATVRWSVWSYGGDTGIFAQTTMNTFAGFYNYSEGVSHFAVHWSPILATLYPFVAVTRSPLALQFVEIVLVGATIFPFYALLRRYASDDLASRIALLALIYPPLAAIAFEEFHELAFFPLVMLLLVWSIDAGKWPVFAACSVLSVLIREDASLVIGCFGLVLVAAGLLRRSQPGSGLLYLAPSSPRAAIAAGLTLVVLSAAASATYFLAVAPALGGWRPSHFYHYAFADGPLAVIVALATQPQIAVPAIFTAGRFTFLLEAFVPLLLLPLRSTWLFVAAPGLVIVLLANDGLIWRMGSHYVAIFLPALLIGTAASVIAIARDRPARGLRYMTIVLGLCTVMLVAFNPMHLGYFLRPPYPDLADVRSAFAVVPRDAAVSTHDEWYTHYALAYPHVASSSVLPTQYGVYADDFTFPQFKELTLPWLKRELRAGRWRVIATFGRVKVYQHT